MLKNINILFLFTDIIQLRGDYMKTCPRCGSALADNEPYCENCGFDPDYDSEDWED